MITRAMIPTLHSLVKARAIRMSAYSLLAWGIINIAAWFFLGAADRQFFSTLSNPSAEIFLLVHASALIGNAMLIFGALGIFISVPAIMLLDGISLFLVGSWNIASDFLAIHALQPYGYTVKPGAVWIIVGASQVVWGFRQLSHYARVSSWRDASVPSHGREQLRQMLVAFVKQPEDAAAGRLKATIHIGGLIPQTERYSGSLDGDCAIFVSNKLNSCFLIHKSVARTAALDKNGKLRIETDAGTKSMTLEAPSLAAFVRWSGGQIDGAGARISGGANEEIAGPSKSERMGDDSAFGFKSALAVAGQTPVEEQGKNASAGGLGDWLKRQQGKERPPPLVPRPQSAASENEPHTAAPSASSAEKDRSLARKSGGLTEWIGKRKKTSGFPEESKTAPLRPAGVPPVAKEEYLAEGGGGSGKQPVTTPPAPTPSLKQSAGQGVRPPEQEPSNSGGQSLPEPATVESHIKGGEIRNVERVPEMAAPASPAEGEGSRPSGTHSLPRGIYAHFLLVDIASPVREIRGVPRYLQMKETPTFLGRFEKAQILLDDPRTVHLKHARVDLREKDGRATFVLCPVEDAPVNVNGQTVTNAGFALQSEDLVQIGSAKLIFFQTDLNAAPIHNRHAQG